MNRPDDDRAHVRLQKFLADAGIASRRDAETLILDGRVLVNGQVVEALPAFVDPRHDAVIVDGHRVRPHRPVYAILNKPTGVVVAARDPAGRRRVYDLLPPVFGRVLPVGRMDAEAGGLLLLTNDGDLAGRLGHRFSTLTAEYQVEVRGQVASAVIARLRSGVHLSEGRVTIERGEVRHTTRERSVLWIELRERVNRQLRRMLAQVGHPVRKLQRLAYGPLRAKGLPIGASRELSDDEIAMLRGAARKRDRSQARLRSPLVRGKPRPDAAAVSDAEMTERPLMEPAPSGPPPKRAGRPPRRGGSSSPERSAQTRNRSAPPRPKRGAPAAAGGSARPQKQSAGGPKRGDGPKKPPGRRIVS
ncbi:MAG: rRNA pseudouridine synthase [Planctomycetia bacterium]|nr:MAG: rRNA pseudouridine synthase [Planctomycetia bacterium]